MKRTGILFVCMGNICRSPTAEGVFRKLVQDEGLEHAFLIDSAGTIGYHVGEAPDPRTQAAARRRGIDLSALRARKVEREDFERFRYILAMDRDNLAHLESMRPPGSQAHVGLFLSFADGIDVDEVPDPYYGGARGFEEVLDLVEAGARGLLEHLRGELSAKR